MPLKTIKNPADVAGLDFILDPSLVLYLPFYALDGDSFMSKDAYGRLCTVTGAAWRSTGRLFDGVDDLITVPDHASIRNLATITICAWVNPAGAGELDGGRIVDKNSATLRFHIYASTRTIALQRDYTGTLVRVSNETLALNAWSFVVATMSSNSAANLYINGVEATYGTSTNATGALANDTANLIVGNNSDTTRTWNGLISELWIYNRVLTLLEMQPKYLGTKWRYR